MTIEELDDPSDGRATAGVLLGLTATAVATAPLPGTPVVSEPCERTTQRDPSGVITMS
jgi:hypothetical protein